jgi:hypothetical protein
MRITVNGVEIDVPEDTTVDIVRGDDGDLQVFVDNEFDDDLGSPTRMSVPSAAWAALFMQPNPLLNELPFVGVNTASGPDESRAPFVGVDMTSGPDETVVWKTSYPPETSTDESRPQCGCDECVAMRGQPDAPETAVDMAYAQAWADIVDAIGRRARNVLGEPQVAAFYKQLATQGFARIGMTFTAKDLERT